MLITSCLTSRKIIGPEGTIELKDEKVSVMEKTSALEASSVVSEASSVAVEGEVVTPDVSVAEPSENEALQTEAVAEIPAETNTAETSEMQIRPADAPAFVEVTEEEKQTLAKESEDTEDIRYVYRPSENEDAARIGGVDIPKWFAYLCSGIIVAILIALCYISNQSKKKMYYYGRRD